MQYRILMTTLGLVMALSSPATQAAEVGGMWSTKAFSVSSARAWMVGPTYSFHRSGSFAAAPTSALSLSAAGNGNSINNSERADVADYLGNTSMFADFAPLSTHASAAPTLAAPGRVVRSIDAATEAPSPPFAGLSTDSKGLMTLLAGIGVIGFLTFKRGVAQSRY